jgi:hypothetical protein
LINLIGCMTLPMPRLRANPRSVARRAQFSTGLASNVEALREVDVT